MRREVFRTKAKLKRQRIGTKRGGIVGFMWYWNSPSSDSSIYAKDTKFSLKSAMTEEDISQMGIAEIQDLYKRGKSLRECFSQGDRFCSGRFVSVGRGNTYSLRPLQVAGGGWYWWGA